MLMLLRGHDRSIAYRYTQVLTGQLSVGHPAAPTIERVVAGIKGRAQRTTRLQKPSDYWVEFADASSGEPYFYNLATSERRRDFPRLERLTPCVMPPRPLEPSAKVLAAAGEASWPEVRGDYGRLQSVARHQLWNEQRRAARGARLAHQPCPLDTLIQKAQHLGFDASEQPELMWLVDCALTPEMPVGWLRVSVDGAAEGLAEYFWNTSTGLTQYEHPHESFLVGVVARLVAASREEAERLAAFESPQAA